MEASLSNPDEFVDLVGGIYECALEPQLWPAILERVAALVSAKAVTLQTFDPQTNEVHFSVEHGTDPKWSALLHSTYAALCPIGPIAMLAEVGESGSIFDYIDEPEFRETRFYREWCAPQDYFDMIGALISKRPSEFGSFSAMGGEAKGRFDLGSIRLMGLLAPHVRRAVTISGLIGHRTIERNSLAAVIDQLQAAVIIVAKSGRILQHNKAAGALLATGRLVQTRSGLIAAADEETTRALRSALGVATVAASRFVPLGEIDGQRHLAAVVPLDDAGQQIALFLHAPAADTPAVAKRLVEIYGFTPREVAVLLELLQGRSVAEAAESLGVSLATTRTHVQRLLEKTGTTRQTDLVRVIMQVLPPIRL